MNIKSDLVKQKEIYMHMAQGGSESITSFNISVTNQLDAFKHLGYIVDNEKIAANFICTFNSDYCEYKQKMSTAEG